METLVAQPQECDDVAAERIAEAAEAQSTSDASVDEEEGANEPVDLDKSDALEPTDVEDIEDTLDSVPALTDEAQSGIKELNENPVNENSDGDAVVVSSEEQKSGDSERPAIAELRTELQAIREKLHTSGSSDIRSWLNRPPVSLLMGDDSQSMLVISLVAPCSESRIRSDSTLKGTGRAVIPFEDGIYRGQVRRTRDADNEEDQQEATIIPEGFGILTSQTGQRRVGRWESGQQVGAGVLQSAVFLYDGQWQPHTGPSGYGVGTFPFGVSFTGCWYQGRPYGLGRMDKMDEGCVQEGWFDGLQCIQSVTVENDESSHESCLLSHLPQQTFEDQPRRGLFIIGRKLEMNRLDSLRHALATWRQYACDHALSMARTARSQAIGARMQAQIEEEAAIGVELSEQLNHAREDKVSILQALSSGRARYDRLRRTRVFHTNKLNTSIFQRDLAERCVETQAASVVLLEQELAEVVLLVDEAKAAEESCRQISQRLQHVKRQIENATVKINALRNEQRASLARTGSLHDTDEMERLALRTPATPAHAKALHERRLSKSHHYDGTLPYVCDTPGCSCGIPRDTFLRVAAALNGEM